MSIEDELSRHLRSKAAAVRSAPDLDDLSGRIRARGRRAARRERIALGAAVIVLAASVGGLAGALASVHDAKTNNGLLARDEPSATPKTTSHHTPAPPAGSNPSEAMGARTVIDRQPAGGLSISATVQAFSAPVAITSQWSTASSCAHGEIVTTTVGQGGSFGGGTSVAQLPMLAPTGLEILDSGVLQVPGGGEEWWVTAAVGSAVTRVAAENVGGTPVTSQPSAGIAVVAGPMSGPSAGVDDMSAVAEGGAGDESLGFVLGSGPKAVGESSTVSDVSGCSALDLPAEPSSASSSQPAEPALAAGAIIAAFEQADSGNPLLGFAANLAAVNGGGLLSTAAPSSSSGTTGTQEAPAGAAAPPTPSRAAASGGSVTVRQVSFLSASRAEVVYRVNGGVLLTGQAVLGASGIWRVSLATFCAGVRTGTVGGDIPTSVIAACQSQA
ncbi:MAG: hypothetical protein ABSH30_00615 [Acidimicrobiales bacterium]|jgi:hypothetical protein